MAMTAERMGLPTRQQQRKTRKQALCFGVDMAQSIVKGLASIFFFSPRLGVTSPQLLVRAASAMHGPAACFIDAVESKQRIPSPWPHYALNEKK